MRLHQIELGERYLAKVSRSVNVVRVVGIVREYCGKTTRTVIYAINEATGRKIVIRSPQRLRCRWDG